MIKHLRSTLPSAMNLFLPLLVFVSVSRLSKPLGSNIPRVSFDISSHCISRSPLISWVATIGAVLSMSRR